MLTPRSVELDIACGTRLMFTVVVVACHISLYADRCIEMIDTRGPYLKEERCDARARVEMIKHSRDMFKRDNMPFKTKLLGLEVWTRKIQFRTLLHKVSPWTRQS